MKTSDSTTNIFPALALAQGEMTDPPKDAENPFFKSTYLSLVGLHRMARGILAKHGLAVIQSYTGVGLETLLSHSSGEWLLLDPMPLPIEKPTAQGMGSAMTYAMRYALGGLLQIAGDDDDGNIASAKPAPAKPRTENIPAPPATPAKTLGLARGLCVMRGLSRAGKKGEAGEETESRREQNCASIAAWLAERKFPTNKHDDQLAHMSQAELSDVIDLLKQELAEMEKK